MRSLEEHLALYGIRHFSGEDYWEWASRCLDETSAKRVDELRRVATRRGSRKRPRDLLAFYDFVADPNIAPVVHSMKADAIRVSGEAVMERLAGRTNILDLGCGIGYLSTGYGQLDQGRRVAGVDFSEASIAEAARMAAKQRIQNVRFLVLDICEAQAGTFDQGGKQEKFDAIVDTQTIQMTPNLPKTFANVKPWLEPGGLLISVPALETARHARAFIRCLMCAGFKLKSFDFVESVDGGNPGAYPVLTAALEGSTISVNLEEEYEKMWQQLNPTGAGSPGDRFE